MRVDPMVLAVGAGLVAVIFYALGWVVGNWSAESEIEALEAELKRDRALTRQRFRQASADADEALASGRLKL